MEMLELIALGSFAYLCGSIPFAKIIGRFYGIDIQKRGSGNIGFANVLRVLGWRAAIPVLILDTAKGFMPTYLTYSLFDATTAFLVGFLAVLGHLAPVWLKFRGGKGISTSFGVVLGITPLVGLSGFVVYTLAAAIFRKSSLASLIAGVVVLITGLVMYPAFWWAYGVLLACAAFKLRKNFIGKIPNYDDI